MGTGPLTEAEAEKAGLVPRYAYGVLQVVGIFGCKLLQLKNLWSERRWRVHNLLMLKHSLFHLASVNEGELLRV